MSAKQSPPSLQLEQAVRFFQQGQPANAEQACLEALRHEPDNATGHHLLGVVRSHMGRFAEALANYDDALKAGPNFTLLYNRGIAFRALKRSNEALASFDQALLLDPASSEAWNARGNVLRALGQSREAIASFDKALALKPAAPETLYNRGTTLFGMKRFAEALENFDKALALKPEMPEVLINRGLALRALKRLQEALVSFDNALALDPNNINGLNNRGVTLQDLKNFADAKASYDKALEFEPGNTELLNNRAKVLCESGAIAEGLALFMRSAGIARAKNTPIEDELPHKIRHDAEQREHLSAIQHPERGERLTAHAIRQNNNVEDIAHLWQTSDPQIVVIDNLLTDEALEKLRRFCRDTPMWNAAYEGGYLGAWPEQGFACPLLAQIAEELGSTFPAIFRDHPLHYLWAFKYDSSLSGIKIHADEAAVNVNFWITPDEANLDPEHGGLVVWDAAAPLDWDFDKFNNDHAAMRDFLAKQGAKSVTIPYRANRAVIFNSDLFHETDTIKFKDGYLNRRLNVTLLYGRREWVEATG